MTKNEKQHLIGGGIVLLFALALWHTDLSLGWFLIVCGWAAGLAVEAYQWFRKEGTPTLRGAALSATLPTAAGLVYELWGFT